MTISVRHGADLFGTFRSEWRALADRAPVATPFQTPEWAETWLRWYGKGLRPFALEMREGDDLVGVFPLVRSHSPWRAMRTIGTGPSDYLHPLAEAGKEAEVAREIRNWMGERRGLIDLHQVREDMPLGDEPGGLDQAVCLVLDLPGTYDDYLKTLGKSLRYDARRLDKLPVEIKTGREIDVFLDLHTRRWRKRGLPGAFLGRATGFHREWTTVAEREGWLRMTVLRHEGNAVGALYGMTMGRTSYYYQAGFDPEAKAISPGTLLVAHAIRTAIEEGANVFDFMRGDEPYKRRWKPTRELHNRRFLRTGPGPVAKAGEVWNRQGFRLENRVRARLEGRGLLG
ncbi:GNAT family N-acetyltransferase [bacterium]|nr:MAG: GNAT family N-acetyltransferase [bacterium]